MDPRVRLEQLLDTVPGLHENLFGLRPLGLAADSPAMSDSAESDSLGPLVRQGAAVALTNSLDHLNAWARLYGRGRLAPTFAHMTLLRSTVEGASTARWLIDPTVEARVRIARGVGTQLADLAERNKIERLSGATLGAADPDWMSAVDRARELEEAAAAAGVCPLRISHTDVVARYGPGEFAYRFLCAFAHGGLALTLAASQRSSAETEDADGLRGVLVEADDEKALQMTEASVRVARQALAELYAYHGRTLEAAVGL